MPTLVSLQSGVPLASISLSITQGHLGDAPCHLEKALEMLAGSSPELLTQNTLLLLKLFPLCTTREPKQRARQLKVLIFLGFIMALTGHDHECFQLFFT